MARQVRQDGHACHNKRFTVPRRERKPTEEIKKLGGAVADVVSLPTLLARYHIVDFVDFDVQGAEWLLFNHTPPAAALLAQETLDTKVLRIHIGTHDTPTDGASLTFNERELVTSFSQRGWKPSWVMGVTGGECASAPEKRLSRPSPWGPMCMADGALSFVNERLLRRLHRTEATENGMPLRPGGRFESGRSRAFAISRPNSGL